MITLQPGNDLAYVELIADSTKYVAKLLGIYYASSNLVLRNIQLSSRLNYRRIANIK
jgi:hypothetical protein